MMMSKSMGDLADYLYSGNRSEEGRHEPGHTTTRAGTAVGDSSAGSVMVILSDDTTQPEDGIDRGTAVELPTTVNVRAGDRVIVTLVGGTLKSPHVSGVIGRGDELASDVADAAALAGAAVQSVDVEYAQSASQTVPPTGGWSTEAPAWQEGTHIWTRTKTVSASGASYSDPACISGRDGQDGAQGPTGPQGPAGAQGATGVGVSAIEEQYYLSTSATSQTGGSWSASQPQWQEGRHIWTRSQITWTDGTTTHTAPVLAQAVNGANSSAASAQQAASQAQADVDASRSWYAECDTPAATAAKAATIVPATGAFSLAPGRVVFVRFSATNTAAVASLTLDVDGTGAKPVRTLYNQSLSNLYHPSHLAAGITYQCTYDGSVWIVQQNVNVDTYDRIRHSNSVKTASITVQGSTYAVLSSSLIAWQIDGYRTVKIGDTIDISRPLLWCMSNVGPSTNTTSTYDAYPSQSLRVNAGGSWTGTKDTIAYLYGTLSANDLSVEGFTSTVPTAEDGKIYIPLGLLYSTFQIAFRSTYETWAYLEGAFQQVKWSALRKSASLEQTAESFTIQFETQGGLIAGIQSALGSKADADALTDLDDRTVKFTDTRLSWLRVQDEGGVPSLILGTSASDFHSRLTNSKMGFYDGGTELAYLSGTDGLAAPRATVSNEFRIGGWALIPQSDGNLSLKYIGG